jgi:hypothetical protein
MDFGPNMEKAGGARYNAGKEQYHSLPVLAFKEIAKVGTQGAEKYGHFNWWKGQAFSTLVNSAMRHMLKVLWNPASVDPESGQYHAAHVAWNVMAILHFIAEGQDGRLNDIEEERRTLATNHHPPPVTPSLTEYPSQYESDDRYDAMRYNSPSYAPVSPEDGNS